MIHYAHEHYPTYPSHFAVFFDPLSAFFLLCDQQSAAFSVENHFLRLHFKNAASQGGDERARRSNPLFNQHQGVENPSACVVFW